MSDIVYALGHADPELHRLEMQAAVVAPATEHMLRSAGLRPGQSVLDIGTGVGDVALMAADLVGPTGTVLGIDREEKPLGRARDRAEASGKSAIVRFELADPETWPTEQRFDFVVGRFVLSWQADQPAFLARAASLAKPGGTMLFIEPGMLDAYDRVGRPRLSNPVVPLFETVSGYVLQALQCVGFHIETGANFARLFREAGLPEPTTALEQLIGGPHSSLPIYTTLLLRSLLPVLEARGIVKAEELEVDTLPLRLQAAAAATHSQLLSLVAVGGWSTIG